MEQAVAAGLSEGGDWCDLYFEYTVYNDLLLKDGEVNDGGYNEDFGVGIRVLDGDRTGYAYSESTELKDMLAAAKAASSIACRTASGCKASVIQAGTAGLHRESCSGMNGVSTATDSLYATGKTWDNVQHAMFLPFLKRIDSSVRSKDGSIVRVMVHFADYQSYVMMFNSLGELVVDSRPMCGITVTAVFSRNGKTENSTASWSHRCGAEMLSPELAERLACDVVKGIDARFEARRPKGGEMPVVMGAGGSGILLHEAIGHSFEADFNRKGVSIFSDRMGKQVCSPDINIVDDGTLPHFRGSVNVDDEGVPGQKTYMVRNGILNSYLHDRISARHYGVAPTGNGRRESFRYMPIPRMRSTYMENGPATEEDLIRSVKKGIYVDNFANGQVQIGAGDFTFYVKSGYLIEDGRLTRPVKDTNIIGNGPEALASITGVADNLIVDDGTWTCGKGQYCPVSCGMPSVLVSKLNVGGINE